MAWPAFDQTQLERSAEAVAAPGLGHRCLRRGCVCSVPRSRAPMSRDSRQSSPRARPATASRRSCSTRTTTCSLPAMTPLWETPPFEPTVRDGRLYGRGAADDKAGIMAHIASIRAVHEVLGDDLDLGIAMFIEGEEGSTGLVPSLSSSPTTRRRSARTPSSSPTPVTGIRSPRASRVSLRGNARFTLRVRTLDHGVPLGDVRGSGARRDDVDRETALHAVELRRLGGGGGG